MTRRNLTAAVLLAALLGAGACAPDTSDGDGGSESKSTKKGAKDVTLTLNWVPYGEHAPFYYGLAKGIYEDEGINLTIKPGNGSAATVQQVAQGQTTFGWADTPALLNGINEGMPVKSLGVFLQKGPASIEFLASEGIKVPGDLEGKKIGGTPGDAMYSTFPGWLKKNDVDPEKVEIVNMDPPAKIANLAEGKVDAIMGFFHDQGPTIEDKTGKKVEYLLYADYGMNVLGTGIVANTEALADDPELAKAFHRATAKAWEGAAEHPDEAVQIMADKAVGAPPQTVLASQLEKTLPLLESAAGVGVNADAKWQETIDLLKEGGMLKEAKAPADYWDASVAVQG